MIVLAAICVVCATTSVLSAADDETNDKALRQAQLAWQKIKIATSSETQDRTSEAYWDDVAVSAGDEFDRLCTEPGLETKMRFFADQFGRHGSEADMRWMYAASYVVLFPSMSVPEKLDNQDLPERGRALAVKIHNSQNLVAEVQFKRFLKEPKMLGRYYHFVVWYDQVFRSRMQRFYFRGQLADTREFLSKESPSDYWWHARNFMILAYRTGGEELLKDAKPKELKQRFKKWDSWYLENRRFLKLDTHKLRWVLDVDAKKNEKLYFGNDYLPDVTIPKTPFPDWDGASPKSMRVHAFDAAR